MLPIKLMTYFLSMKIKITRILKSKDNKIISKYSKIFNKKLETYKNS